MAMTKAELIDENKALAESIAFLKRQRAEFEERLIRVASQAAVEHDLCRVLDETLAEVGIKVPEVEVVVTKHEKHRVSLLDAAYVGLSNPDASLRDKIEAVTNGERYDDKAGTEVRIFTDDTRTESTITEVEVFAA